MAHWFAFHYSMANKIGKQGGRNGPDSGSEPTPLPLMDVIGKSLTIRGYILFEVTGDLAQL